MIPSSLRWSIEFGAHRNGSPELHDMLADYIYSESSELVYPICFFMLYDLSLFCIFYHEFKLVFLEPPTHIRGKGWHL